MNRDELVEYLNFKLALNGAAIVGDKRDFPLLELGEGLVNTVREKNRLLENHYCPADARAQAFLDDYFSDVDYETPRLPGDSMQLEFHGLARLLSLPTTQDEYYSDIISSYRVAQGVIHNPKNDRRTTKGVFHVVEGGIAVPADKKKVPKETFLRLLSHALNPPRESMRLPFTSDQPNPAELFVSLLLKPTVCPEAPGYSARRYMETRFYAPGSLVANLDFVESIFGNAGSPFAIENDGGLDPEGWSGHTGLVILAPHLVRLTKKELGLPHKSEAPNERCLKDGMYWTEPDELYNDGGGFKVTCRDSRGVIVTLIADNYFGYCKKEVKTQISYATNLFGSCEEEHAGGAIAFRSYDLGDEFQLSRYFPVVDHRFKDVVSLYGAVMDLMPEGYGIDKNYPDIVYLPEDVSIHLREQRIRWTVDGDAHEIKLLPHRTYVLPSGYKVEMRKDEAIRRWRLIGSSAEGIFCHKPCTVSGGGKSEISKSISDSIHAGPVLVSNFNSDFDKVEEILFADDRYGNRFKEEVGHKYLGRSLLDPKRSLGSVIKLLTPRTEYRDEYNDWLKTFSPGVKQIVYTIKLLYRPHWGRDIRSRFSVDTVNGIEGYELKYRDQKLYTQFMRIGYSQDGGWRIFSLRRDFAPAAKIQTEDDISVSITVNASEFDTLAETYSAPAVKFIENCENRFFQRPDEAVHRGYDKQTEKDYAGDNIFFCNYHPTTREEAREEVENALLFDRYTDPMKKRLTDFLASDDRFVVTGAFPRIVDGKPTKNPRYLQTALSLQDPRSTYIAKMGARMLRRIPREKSVPFPVNAVMTGRRNNPAQPELKIRPLAVFNPIHYQDLPELFMDFVSSLTGKSPSTTGAGSEGALTKGPFNALPTVYDLNASLVCFLLGKYDGFSSAAGYIGVKYRVDHDISLLIPEIWARMDEEERDAKFLIEHRFLEPLEDFERDGENIEASRLGYRITEKFVRIFLGRLFSHPQSVMPEDMLKPEMQGMDAYVDGIKNICETQRRVALNYFEDNTVEMAIPPLKALLHMMAYGEYEGKTVKDPEFRGSFSREALLGSDWYRRRLEAKRDRDLRFLKERHAALTRFQEEGAGRIGADRIDIRERLAHSQSEIARLEEPEFVESLVGMIGRDPNFSGD